MEDLETTGYYSLGIPAYLLVILIEIAVTRRSGLRTYRFAETLSNLTTGLGALLVGLFLAPWLIALYDFGLEHLALFRWPEGSWLKWPFALLLADLCYYVYHRAGHTFGLLWGVHGVHHQAEHFNMTVAMRMPWFADLYSFPFYAPLPMFGVDRACFFVCIAIISFYALTVHSMSFHRPGFGVLVTPATHIVHHSRNRRYLGKNMGAMFTIWDRLFGTHVDVVPEDPPEIGMPVGYRSHDGVVAQYILFSDIRRNAQTWGDRARVLWERPGWRPAGVEAIRDAKAREDGDISAGMRVYLLVQFAIVSVLGTAILWARDGIGVGEQILGAGLVFWGIRTIGGFLDGREGTEREEAVRLAVSVILGILVGVF